jgi:ATP-dependent RNA helicase RhlE
MASAQSAARRMVRCAPVADGPKGYLLTQFSDLGLERPILDALATEGYTTPTPIQAQAIPHVLAGRDLLGIAATGTGKTAAFALPILQRLAATKDVAPRGGCRALVLAPTRELIAQIGDSFRAYGRNHRLRVAVIVGGVPFRPQATALAKGVDILVATPGRLLDHVSQGTVRLETATTLVLDEADHMLDLGFIPAVRKLVAKMPRKRQNLLFSATMPGEIRALASDFLHEPETVSVAPQGTLAERIDQRLIHVEPSRKGAVLAELVNGGNRRRVLVFTRTKRGADRVVRGLAAARIDAVAIHGNKSQSQRERALDGFRTGRSPVLVATDIAARGIDVDDIALVVNYDLPHVAETYVHRIGRTARAGAAGTAISFCGTEDRPLLRAIEALIKMRIPASTDSAASGRERSEAPPAPAAHNAKRAPRAAAPAARTAPDGHGPRLDELPFMRSGETRPRPQAPRHHRRRPTRRATRHAAPAHQHGS